jgi:hyperosmotically inducible periplasmic protein
MKLHVFLMTALLAGLSACSGQQQQHAQSAADHAYRLASVKAKLVGVDVDAATKVNVTESGGVVTLSGEAQNAAERDRYVAAAQSVGGVTSVQDEISVNPSMKGIRQNASDAALDARVSAAIVSEAGENVFHVHPTSNGGVVTLHGTVPSRSVQQTIHQTVERVPGVKQLIDATTVRSQ